MCLHMGLKLPAIKRMDYRFTVNPGNEHDSRTLKGFMTSLHMLE